MKIADITIYDLKDGEILNGPDELLTKETIYDKQDIDELLNFKLDWNKSDAMILQIKPTDDREFEITIPTLPVDIIQRVFWDEYESSIINIKANSEPKIFKHVYENTDVRDIHIIGDASLFISKGEVQDIKQFGTQTRIVHLGNILGRLARFSKTLDSVVALDRFNSQELLVLDEATLLNLTNDQIPNMTNWDVRNVISMRGLLKNRTEFDQDLSNWDTRNLIYIKDIFLGLTTIPFNLDSWDLSNIISMDELFKDKDLSNQTFNNWHTNYLISAVSMFENAINVPDLLNLRTVNILYAARMFRNITIDSHGIYNDFSNVIDAELMFNNTTFKDCEVKDLTFNHLENGKGMFNSCIIDNSYFENLTFNNDCDLSNFLLNASIINHNNSTDVFKDFNFIGQIEFDSALSYIDFGSSNGKDGLNTWNTIGFVSLYKTFEQCTTNVEIGSWNVENVKTLSATFKDFAEFNCNINNWNTGKCVTFEETFYNCLVFNQPLNNLEVGNVISTAYAFYNCREFNQNLDMWITSSLYDTSFMFYNCVSFNGLLTSWVTDGLLFSSSMFKGCSIFNQPLNFNMINIQNIDKMFMNCLDFNQDLNDWTMYNLAGVNNSVFEGCSDFNGSVNNWDWGNAIKTDRIFKDCISFNKPLNWKIVKSESSISFLDSCVVFNSSIDIDLNKSLNFSFFFNDCSVYNSPMNIIFNNETTNSGSVSFENFLSNCRVFNQTLNLPSKIIGSFKKGLYYCEELVFDIGTMNVEGITDLSYAFSHGLKLLFNIQNWDLKECLTLKSAFTYTNINVDLSNLKFPKVKDFSFTFYKCTELNNINIDNWDITNVDAVYKMLGYCSNYTNHDLSGWHGYNASHDEFDAYIEQNIFYGMADGHGNTEPDWEAQ
jgi:surface protein